MGHSDSGLSGQQVWQRLLEGNRRFCENRPLARDLTGLRRGLAAGQRPCAAVLCCSDSRVSPEVVFDQSLGDLFVVRTAGLTLDAAGLGSLEYAVAHLKVPLVVLKGHEACGAVQAAYQHPDLREGHITAVVEKIRPAVVEIRRQGISGPEAVERVNDFHLRSIFATLGHQSEIIGTALAQGRLQMILCKYHLESGAVELLAATF